ncbi:MAG TPA: glycosyltransferase family 2 protein [Patescibacteria group bacterium]|nr:glycosyltransferase family 2 protein [Patescibacteria group bacterium]
MNVTVIIATRNRSEGLRHTLESILCDANLNQPDWEVVVVDNASDDATPEVCRAFCSKHPTAMRYLVEKQVGKSNALNLGISAAKGGILAFTDDDVICADDYIPSILNVFEKTSADAAQGRVFLDFEGGEPPWISSLHRDFLSCCDYGDEIIESFTHPISGTNMVVRAEAARAVGGFAPELGPGTAGGFSDDTEFSWRLKRAGCRLIYAPQIVARHQVSRNRLTRRYLRARYFRLGRSRAYYGPYEAPLWRFGLYVVKNWMIRDVKAVWHRRNGRLAEALDCQCQARFQAGFFWQHCLFYFGVPRRLTRVTSWPVQAAACGEAVEQQPGVDAAHQAQAAQG